MRLLAVVALFVFTLACVLLLNTRIGHYPPIGRFLDPVNGFWANSQKEGIQAPETIELPGLKQPTTVHWDKTLIPHIVAQNAHDLYFAQGYATAFHRLWQMELQLFKTAGRLSEVLGASTLETDRWQRRKGLRYAAEALCAEANKLSETQIMLLAYSKGVNAYIESLTYADYPLEYKLLDYAPEAWSPYKSCLMFKEMGDVLSLDDRDIENTQLLQHLGEETFDLLFPDSYSDVSYMIPSGTRFNFEPLQRPSGGKNIKSLKLGLPGQESGSPSTNGSNTVAIAPTKSATAGVLLSNAPDLNMSLPSLWYITHLTAPNINSMGASAPGLPGIILGFNDSIAWGLTNADRDLSDWYQVTFTDESRQEYVYNNYRYKVNMRLEEIQVRAGDDVYDTVAYTHHGPVVYDRNYTKGTFKGINLARHWSGYTPYNELRGMYYLNRATSYEHFTEAISHIKTPALSFSFGSVSGDIAMHVQGALPLKWEGQGKFVMDGRYRENDWQGLAPQEHAPYIKNPKRGYVSSANQQAVDKAYPYYLYAYKFDQFRGRRLNERLAKIEQVDVSDLIRLQYDNFNYQAYEALPRMLSGIDRELLSVEESKIYNILEKWDYFSEAKREAPSYYEKWFDALKELIWDEFDTIPAPKYLPNDHTTIQLIRQQPDLPFYDKIGTSRVETLDDIILESFKKSVLELALWKKTHKKAPIWANVRNTVIRHLLRIDPFSAKELLIGGNSSILNAVGKYKGPSFRLVVSLGEENVEAWAIYPGGQPGAPGHPAYTAFVPRWVQADYIKLLFTKSEAQLRQQSILSQTFHP